MDKSVHEAVMSMSQSVAGFWDSETESGQGLVEYALILLLVSVAAVGTLGIFGSGLVSLYGRILAGLPF